MKQFLPAIRIIKKREFMTKEETLEYNKRCASFLGWKPYNGLNPKYNFSYTTNEINFGEMVVFPSYLKFHSDWNWIMEVVETIEKLNILLPEKYKRGFLKNSTHGNIIIQSDYDSREEFKGWYSSCSIELSHPFIYDSLNCEKSRFETKKEALVEAINHFLIWYEQNK